MALKPDRSAYWTVEQLFHRQRRFSLSIKGLGGRRGREGRWTEATTKGKFRRRIAGTLNPVSEGIQWMTQSVCCGGICHPALWKRNQARGLQDRPTVTSLLILERLQEHLPPNYQNYLHLSMSPDVAWSRCNKFPLGIENMTDVRSLWPLTLVNPFSSPSSHKGVLKYCVRKIGATQKQSSHMFQKWGGMKRAWHNNWPLSRYTRTKKSLNASHPTSLKPILRAQNRSGIVQFYLFMVSVSLSNFVLWWCRKSNQPKRGKIIFFAFPEAYFWSKYVK